MKRDSPRTLPSFLMNPGPVVVPEISSPQLPWRTNTKTANARNNAIFDDCRSKLSPLL